MPFLDWKNAIFPQKSQIFHIHSKFIVWFSPISACKFVKLVSTWCRKLFWKFYDIFGLWKSTTFFFKLKKTHLHSKVIVRVSPIFSCKLVHLVSTWCCKRFWIFLIFVNYMIWYNMTLFDIIFFRISSKFSKNSYL